MSHDYFQKKSWAWNINLYIYIIKYSREQHDIYNINTMQLNITVHSNLNKAKALKKWKQGF